MWHKPCRTFHPWCPCIKTRCLFICFIKTSSNGNIFRVTGPLCGEFTAPGEFPSQRPVTQSFDVFYDLRLNKRLSKQSRRRWFETPLWRHCNVYSFHYSYINVIGCEWLSANCTQHGKYQYIQLLYINIEELSDAYMRQWKIHHWIG